MHATAAPSCYTCAVCSSAITAPGLTNLEYRADFVRDSLTTVRLVHKPCSHDHSWYWATGRAFVGVRGYWVADKVVSLAKRGGCDVSWLMRFALDHGREPWRTSFCEWFEGGLR